jgi:hypothetical protein
MPKKVLAICFGTGITFGTLGQFDVEHIDGVELSPEVIEAASEFEEENYAVVENDRVTIHIDDGRNFLLKSTEKYDVITMEPMPLVLSPEKYSERLRSEKLVRDLSLISLSAPDQMAGTFLMDRDALLDLVGDAPVVTDDLPYVEFTAPKSADMSSTARNYLAVTRYARSRASRSNRARRSLFSAKASGKTLMATSRPSLVSRAL